MTTKSQAKISKITAQASLELLHATKKLLTQPTKFIGDLAISLLSPLSEDYEKRTESQMKSEFPEWAKNCYSRDWSFETEQERLSRIRSEAGRKGGQTSKRN